MVEVYNYLGKPFCGKWLSLTTTFKERQDVLVLLELLLTTFYALFGAGQVTVCESPKLAEVCQMKVNCTILFPTTLSTCLK